MDRPTAAGLHIDLTGQVVVVTGIAGGLGQAIAAKFARCGATVAGIDRTASGSYPTFAADITDAGAVKSAFAQLSAQLGMPNVLVNNAGVREVQTALDLSPEEWDKVVSINLNGAFYCAREAAHLMRTGGGSIINTVSVAGLVGITHRPAYTATKHALIGLTKNLSVDLAPFRIRVNAVGPGTVRTALTEHYYADEAFLQDFAATVPLGSSGTADDVANAFAFLASPLAAYITGVVLPVDGGFTSSKSYSYRAGSAYMQSSH